MPDLRGSRGFVMMSLVFAASLFGAAAEAQIRDIYTVDQVHVDERAADELAAKTKGIARAQQEALRRLFELITLRNDHDLLPEIDDTMVQQVIHDYAVAGEKFGGGRYLAELTVRFKPEEMRRLMRAQNMPFAETRSRPVLVLPVYQVAGSILLWDDPNPWFAAWSKRPAPKGLLPLTLPLGDYSDVEEISAEMAVRGNDERLNSIAKKYKALATLVAAARLTIDPATGAPTIQVSMTRYGAGDVGRTLVRSFSAAPGGELEPLLDEAVETLMIQAEEDWKRDNLQTANNDQRITAVVPIVDFGEWLEIRERLGRISTLKQVDVMRISIKEAEISLKFSGGADQLRLAMAQSDLDLAYVQAQNGYVLRLGDKR